jgi:hypothetical protein
MRPTSIRETGAPPGPARPPLGRTARKWGRLAVSGSTRRVQVVFEPLDFLTEDVSFAPISVAGLSSPLAVVTEAIDFALLPRDFALLLLELGDQLLARRRAPPRSHASVIAPCTKKYKRKRTSSRPFS